MRISRLLFSVVVLFMLTAALVIAWLKFGSQSSSFGRINITMQSGSAVYAMRESWGLGSEKLWFTQSSDGCSVADSKRDYIFENPADETVLYAVTPQGLTIFDLPFNHLVEEPTHDWNDVRVFMNRSREPSYDEVRNEPAKFGARLEKIPLNERCWQNLFRRSSSLH
jgi:hypothetical protein